MPIPDEELPKKKKTHEIGEDLAALSLDELDERIELLRGEIRRIEDAIKSKRASAHRRGHLLQALGGYSPSPSESRRPLTIP